MCIYISIVCSGTLIPRIDLVQAIKLEKKSIFKSSCNDHMPFRVRGHKRGGAWVA